MKCKHCTHRDECADDAFINGAEFDLEAEHECAGYEPFTNADRIRAMTDRELARFMAERNVNESTLLLLNKDHGLTAIQIEALRHNVYCALMQWLQQPAEGE